ncbi:MAG: hypothetical protein ACLPIC_18830 [Rhodoblastus sp.]|uniref:hypothetical protein n=1 Tax=Rhodoblastus sp. TaxID=1962975 RepID=UPI003F9543A4
MLDGECEGLTRKAIELALRGDTTALRLCLERLIPVRKEMPLSFKLPPIAKAEDAKAALGDILAGVADGSLLLGEGEALAALLERYVALDGLQQLADRVEALEAAKQQEQDNA